VEERPLLSTFGAGIAFFGVDLAGLGLGLLLDAK